MINFKTYSKSYKNKKRMANDKENWVIFKDVHEPIIERSVWELVQERRNQKTRRRKNADGEKICFPVCWYARLRQQLVVPLQSGQTRKSNISTVPATTGASVKICTSTHYIRVDFLKRLCSVKSGGSQSWQLSMNPNLQRL